MNLQPGTIAYAIYNPQYEGGFGFYVKEIKICRYQYESEGNQTPPPDGMVWVTMRVNKDEAFNARQLINERGIYTTLEKALKALKNFETITDCGNTVGAAISHWFLTEPRKLLKSDSLFEFRENPFANGGKMFLEARFDGQMNKTYFYIHGGAAQYPEILTEFTGEVKNDLAFVKEAIRALKEHEKELKQENK